MVKQRDRYARWLITEMTVQQSACSYRLLFGCTSGEEPVAATAGGAVAEEEGGRATERDRSC